VDKIPGDSGESWESEKKDMPHDKESTSMHWNIFWLVSITFNRSSVIMPPPHTSLLALGLLWARLSLRGGGRKDRHT
jgi:hypothetical protein